jgi:predicted Zn finger-like uncharacterized protein
MLIDCPGCEKSYHIIKAMLAPAGRRVACPRCDSIWFVSAEGISAAEAPDAANLAYQSDLAAIEDDEAIELDLMPVETARAVRPLPAPRRSSYFLTGLMVLALSMGLIGFRQGVVKLWPKAETAYAALGLPVNLRGLSLDHFHTIAIKDGTETVLGIEGDITNLRDKTAKIPPIRLAIRDVHGRILYSWIVAAQDPKLGANKTMNFRTRLAAPPQGGKDVLVDFVPEPRQKLAALWHKALPF